MAKVDELKDVVTALAERVNSLLNALKAIDAAHSETSHIVSDLRRDCEREIALLKREIEDLRKWKEEQKKEREEFSRKLWAFGPNVLGAVINGILAAIIAYFVANR